MQFGSVAGGRHHAVRHSSFEVATYFLSLHRITLSGILRPFD